jgi:hypothetical protein
VYQLLNSYAEQNGVFSPQQRGFRVGKQTQDLLHAMLSAFEDAHIHRRELYVLYLDFSNAFNTVPHDRLFLVMRQLGVPADGIAAVRNIYDGQTTVVITPHGDAGPVDIERGTIQGDTLSPLLFLIMIEPLLRWLRVGGRGYNYTGGSGRGAAPLSCPTFADDMALVAESTRDMQIQSAKVAAYEDWTGMSLGLSKCALTGIFFPDSSAAGPCTKQQLMAKLAGVTHRHAGDQYGQPYPVLGPDEAYKYLGVRICTSLKWDEEFAALSAKVKELCTAFAKQLNELCGPGPQQLLGMSMVVSSLANLIQQNLVEEAVKQQSDELFPEIIN